MTSVTMGPVCTQILEAYGADVVKIEPLEGDIMRHAGARRAPGMRAGAPSNRFAVLGGRPACDRQSKMAAAVAGVSSDALSTMVQPAASAPPSLRATVVPGKFQGVKAATGPMGSGDTIRRVPAGPGTIRP